MTGHRDAVLRLWGRQLHERQCEPLAWAEAVLEATGRPPTAVTAAMSGRLDALADSPSDRAEPLFRTVAKLAANLRGDGHYDADVGTRIGPLALRLGELQPPLADPLGDALGHPPDGPTSLVTVHAADSSGNRTYPKAGHLASAIAAFGAPVVDDLIVLTTDPDPDLRALACRALGSTADDRALPALAHLAAHDLARTTLGGLVATAAKQGLRCRHQLRGRERAGDCLSGVPAVLEKVRSEGSRNRRVYLEVRREDGGRQEIQVSGSTSSSFAPTGTVLRLVGWRGEIRHVDYGTGEAARTVFTEHNPRTAHETALGWALGLGPPSASIRRGRAPTGSGCARARGSGTGPSRPSCSVTTAAPGAPRATATSSWARASSRGPTTRAAVQGARRCRPAWCWSGSGTRTPRTPVPRAGQQGADLSRGPVPGRRHRGAHRGRAARHAPAGRRAHGAGGHVAGGAGPRRDPGRGAAQAAAARGRYGAARYLEALPGGALLVFVRCRIRPGFGRSGRRWLASR
ncbi:HEAT repeat domain-containing protein [Streptomyces sp. NBC_01264]|uniref:HEAT repeat domain-containing protein n=1 Tax=Streptomyces sp. NBC_01264 TaxID=2903804 RepID=UPI002250204F|nr:HEAT repeat domain-containing protein [Streptomyces sp. NBC_01264]MCX4782911.1 HEAT repeat domain-containing protein [Streptomyces sp. NBC_01264]